jgi:hypothetical protein
VSWDLPTWRIMIAVGPDKLRFVGNTNLAIIAQG